jgi:CelD/BcsL family acetyltransferase involved in cellulose biosynthesis
MLPPDIIRFSIQTHLPTEQIAPLWRELEARSDATFFLTWHWMGAWIATLGAPPPLLIGEASGARVLLGFVVPFRRREAGLIRADGLRLHSIGKWEQDCIAIEYNGFLVDHEWAGRAEQAAITWLLNQPNGASLRPNELHVTAMLDQHRETWTPPSTLIQIPNRKPSWRVDLAAIRASGRRYLDTLSANTRAQIRRSMRLFDAVGGLTATWAPDVSTGLSFLDGLRDLHQRQWTARGEPGGFASCFFEQFQRRLIADCLPEGSVEIVRIDRGTEPIGYLYNLIWRGHVFAFVSGLLYEPDNRLKPGLVCHTLCIEHHLQAGNHTYDFMAGYSRYKESLGERGPEFIYLLIQKDTLAARFEHHLRYARDRLRNMARGVMSKPASTRSNSAGSSAHA